MGASDETQASCLLAQSVVVDGPQRTAYVAGKGQEAESFTERGTASIQMEATAEEVIGLIFCSICPGTGHQLLFCPTVIAI
jgi:hypothetical protein